MAFRHAHKVAKAVISSENKHLLVAFEGGLVQMHNVYTGAVIYNRSQDECLDIGHEINSLAFLGKGNFWFVAGCEQGRISFFSQPQTQKGKDYVVQKRTLSYHRRDVACIDVTTENHVVTGSVDNVLTFWHSFNAKAQKTIEIPDSVANSFRNYIMNLRFAVRSSNEFLLIFMSEGQVFCIETLSE